MFIAISVFTLCNNFFITINDRFLSVIFPKDFFHLIFFKLFFLIFYNLLIFLSIYPIYYVFYIKFLPPCFHFLSSPLYQAYLWKYLYLLILVYQLHSSNWYQYHSVHQIIIIITKVMMMFIITNIMSSFLLIFMSATSRFFPLSSANRIKNYLAGFLLKK